MENIEKKTTLEIAKEGRANLVKSIGLIHKEMAEGKIGIIDCISRVDMINNLMADLEVIIANEEGEE